MKATLLDPARLMQKQRLEALKDFAIKYQIANGVRTIRVKKGEKFWIASTPRDFKSTGLIRIHRVDQGTTLTGFPFTLEQLSERFSIAPIGII